MLFGYQLSLQISYFVFVLFCDKRVSKRRQKCYQCSVNPNDQNFWIKTTKNVMYVR